MASTYTFSYIANANNAIPGQYQMVIQVAGGAVPVPILFDAMPNYARLVAGIVPPVAPPVALTFTDDIHNFNAAFRVSDSVKDGNYAPGLFNVIRDSYDYAQVNAVFTNANRCNSWLLRLIQNVELIFAGNISTTAYFPNIITGTQFITLTSSNPVNPEFYYSQETGVELIQYNAIQNPIINPVPVRKLMNLANLVIDEGPRSWTPQDKLLFPEENNGLVFDNTFMEFLKFRDCQIFSTTTLPPVPPPVPPNLIPPEYQNRMDYEIQYNNVRCLDYEGRFECNGNRQIYTESLIISDGLKINSLSNTDKNIALRNIDFSPATKHGHVQLKEMGDVMQVYSYLAFIVAKWQSLLLIYPATTLETMKQSCILSTVDSEVFALCILEGLPCVLFKGLPRQLDLYTPVQQTMAQRIVQKKLMFIANNTIQITIINAIIAGSAIYIAGTIVSLINHQRGNSMITLMNYLRTHITQINNAINAINPNAHNADVNLITNQHKVIPLFLYNEVSRAYTPDYIKTHIDMGDATILFADQMYGTQFITLREALNKLRLGTVYVNNIIPPGFQVAPPLPPPLPPLGIPPGALPVGVAQNRRRTRSMIGGRKSTNDLQTNSDEKIEFNEENVKMLTDGYISFYLEYVHPFIIRRPGNIELLHILANVIIFATGPEINDKIFDYTKDYINELLGKNDKSEEPVTIENISLYDNVPPGAYNKEEVKQNIIKSLDEKFPIMASSDDEMNVNRIDINQTNKLVKGGSLKNRRMSKKMNMKKTKRVNKSKRINKTKKNKKMKKCNKTKP